MAADRLGGIDVLRTRWYGERLPVAVVLRLAGDYLRKLRIRLLPLGQALRAVLRTLVFAPGERVHG